MSSGEKHRYRILLLLKLDAQRLFERIKLRAADYLLDFSLKRTREHLGDVFKSRYPEVKIEELKFCSEEVILNLDHFYHRVDELKWYLYHTEDMPTNVENCVRRDIGKLETSYHALNLYLEAELDSCQVSE